MSAVIQLKPYQNETDTALSLIQAFWLHHSHVEQTAGEAARDLKAWTGDGHAFYLIQCQGQVVGFLHLGSRGGPIDWLEELFILPGRTRASAPRSSARQRRWSGPIPTRSTSRPSPGTRAPSGCTAVWAMIASTPSPSARTCGTPDSAVCGRKNSTICPLKSAKKTEPETLVEYIIHLLENYLTITAESV